MKTTFILVILCGLTGSAFCQQSAANTGNTDADNAFGIFHLFDGITLYNHRTYKANDTPTEYISMDMTPFTVNISDDGNSLIIKNVIYTLQLKKTKLPGEFIVKNRYYKVNAAKFLEDGSFQVFYSHKNVRGPRGKYIEHYQLAGLGLKKTSYEISEGKNSAFIVYYETEKEHKKTSGTNDSYPRIISFGEKAIARNSTFRFAAAAGSQIQITTFNTGNNGNAYVTLYGVDGEIIKEAEGNGTLNISYKISEDGFYYISTMKDDKDALSIILTEK